jgi:multicomponent Na+:H+ antiporter subunit G
VSPLETVLDAVAALCLLGGCALSLSAGIALLRFPDLLSRMHSGTKPQVLGLLLVLLGAALQLPDVPGVVKLALVAVFQLLTAPVATHLLARASYRAGLVDTSVLLADELAPQLGPPDPTPAPEEVPEDVRLQVDGHGEAARPPV